MNSSRDGKGVKSKTQELVSIFKSSAHVTHYVIYTNVKIELVTVKGQLKKKLNRKGEKAEGKCNKILHIYFGKILTVLREDYRLIE